MQQIVLHFVLLSWILFIRLPLVRSQTPTIPEINCTLDPCQHSSSCVEEHSGFHWCLCFGNYYGTFCEYEFVTDQTSSYSTTQSNTAEIDCASNPCQHNSSCVEESSGLHSCICYGNYYGPLCEYEYDTEIDCTLDPCQHKSSCVEEPSGLHWCLCFGNYYGTFCEYEYVTDSDVPESTTVTNIPVTDSDVPESTAVTNIPVTDSDVPESTTITNIPVTATLHTPEHTITTIVSNLGSKMSTATGSDTFNQNTENPTTDRITTMPLSATTVSAKATSESNYTGFIVGAVAAVVLISAVTIGVLVFFKQRQILLSSGAANKSNTQEDSSYSNLKHVHEMTGEDNYTALNVPDTSGNNTIYDNKGIDVGTANHEYITIIE